MRGSLEKPEQEQSDISMIYIIRIKGAKADVFGFKSFEFFVIYYAAVLNKPHSEPLN
jgi:hypothetical protein